MDGESDHNIATARAETPRKPNDMRGVTVLQVLPALVTGGVERGAVDIAEAVVQAGGRAIVVSAGGPMVTELTRVHAEHVILPVDSKNPIVVYKNIQRLADLIVANGVDIVHARSRRITSKSKRAVSTPRGITRMRLVGTP